MTKLEPGEIGTMLAKHLGAMAEAGYRQTGHPGHIWETFKNYRDVGEPPPAWVMDGLDQMAASVTQVLQTGGSNKAVLTALGFASKGGGPGKVRRFAQEARRFQAVYEVWVLQQYLEEHPEAEPVDGEENPGEPPRQFTFGDILDDVAERHGVESETVSNWYYELTEADPDYPNIRRLRR